MGSLPFRLIVVLLMLSLAAYVFEAVKVVAPLPGTPGHLLSFGIYWGICLLGLAGFLAIPLVPSRGRGLRSMAFSVVAALFFGLLIASLLLLADDLRRLLQWIFLRLTGSAGSAGIFIARSLVMSWAALMAGSGLILAMICGFGNKYRYSVRSLRLHFPNLPAPFKGLRIVHLSDIHSGSLRDRAAVELGVETILKLQPDLVLFTGDLVNNQASEMDPFIEVFARIRAPLGVYSTLGNHDYGDYIHWPDEVGGRSELKRRNLERLKGVHAQMGWRLLMNEHVVLERAGERIGLLGIENWSAKARFPRHGRLADAYAGTESLPFKILMSHDPSHWESEVVARYPDIDLTLSGHTHGMQFGLELPWFRWSPVQYVYRHWAGLYEQGRQKLYVNRGFGFLGYPGRVGILPEITFLELA